MASRRDRPGAPAQAPDSLAVEGAATHNLRNVDVRVPHGSLVAFTGRSGSGKSSLVIDTFLAESVRRSSLSMSAYARQFVDQFPKPPYTSISGLRTAVYLEQGQISRNPRSTLGTLTELYDGLRLLMARFGVPTCRVCSTVTTSGPDGWRCPGCGGTTPALDPKDFSFNLPFGVCPTCEGTGSRQRPARNKLVDPALSVLDGALKPFETDRFRQVHREVAAQIVTGSGSDPALPFEDLGTDVQRTLVEADQLVVSMTPAHGKPFETEYVGVAAWVATKFLTATSDGARTKLAPFLTEQSCPSCLGARLGPEPLAYRLNGRNMADLVLMTLTELKGELVAFGASGGTGPAAPTVAEMTAVLDRLEEIGVGYLDLARSAPTLSGGEQQRVRIALQLGADLHGLMYVLDEPSNGLHPADVENLARTLIGLTAQGNTVLLVEHDLTLIRAAGWVVDLGPGAGPEGGSVVYSGRTDQIPTDTVTGPYLARPNPVPDDRSQPPTRFLTIEGASIHNVCNVTVRVARNALTCVVGPSGSGKSSFAYGVLRPALSQRGVVEAGDTPVMFDGTWTGVDGLDGIDRLCVIDQAPIGRTPRSNPATFSGAFDTIRKLFATSASARTAGLTSAHFSFNTPEGRCPACNGEGANRIELGFHPDVFVPCAVCGGSRYHARVLACTVDDLTIADVLNLPVDEATARFARNRAVAAALAPLQQAGLGYVKLGQPAPTLSGGEAQRLKLAKELGGTLPERTMYLLDEPTSGLHPRDVDDQLRVMRQLVDAGASVVVIEHDMRFVGASDWVVEFGPGAGTNGGQVVAMGTPADVVATTGSSTAKYLSPYVR